jgi:hypothetical protein
MSCLVGLTFTGFISPLTVIDKVNLPICIFAARESGRSATL